MRRILGLPVLAGLLLLVAAPFAHAQNGPTLDAVDWMNVPNASGGQNVRFHMRWSNKSPSESTVPIHGTMKSQEFGVFLPDYGLIGYFDVPPLAPDSFFDVFTEIALSDLPREPRKILPGQSPSATALEIPGSSKRVPGATDASGTEPCPPDTIWDGNVDIIWTGPGVAGQFLKHFGDLIVCPGGGPSYIHVRTTNCPVAAPWSVAGLCPGFSVTLVNEDFTPAPNPIPPGWTGYIMVTAAAAVPPGTTCCPILTVTCNGQPATIDLCATTCECGTPNPGPTLGQLDWHNVGSTVQFHMRWGNPSATHTTVPVSGQMFSQDFGVFMPNRGSIGLFNVPPLQPNSFFDVFVEVPLSALPPEPQKILPGAGGAPRLRAARYGATSHGLGDPEPCPPDTIWDGNVDVVWSGAGTAGEVVRHFADLIVCPGGGPTFIHVRSTTCAVPATWSVGGVCPGFAVTLVNEDFTPAPNPIPPGWTGWISVTATAAVTPGTTCCPVLTFDCAGSPATIDLCATACDCGNHTPTLSQLDWHNVGGAVRFHMRWENPSPITVTAEMSGEMRSQPFGVFMPDFGPIGQFIVPPLQPNSFFDVFFDVSLDQLPPQPQKVVPAPPVPGVPCPADTIWDGNVDILWSAAGTNGQIERHYGDLIACPGGGPSYIHVRSTNCTVAATWSISGLCAGFGATLVNEDFTPAPNPIPPGWTGWIAVTAAGGVVPGTVCCFAIELDCAGSPAVMELCATACDCGTLSVPGSTEVDGFGIRSTIPTPTTGSVAITFAIPRDGNATLEIVDASGRRVRTLVEGALSSGPRTFTWDGRAADGQRLPGGAYFVRLYAAGRVASRKVILVR